MVPDDFSEIAEESGKSEQRANAWAEECGGGCRSGMLTLESCVFEVFVVESSDNSGC